MRNADGDKKRAENCVHLRSSLLLLLSSSILRQTALAIYCQALLLYPFPELNCIYLQGGGDVIKKLKTPIYKVGAVL